MFGRLDRSWRPPDQGSDEKGSCVSDQEAWLSFIFKGLKVCDTRWIRKGGSLVDLEWQTFLSSVLAIRSHILLTNFSV
jgi:hypothetical protein